VRGVGEPFALRILLIATDGVSFFIESEEQACLLHAYGVLGCEWVWIGVAEDAARATD
jgi:hypothetical protein